MKVDSMQVSVRCDKRLGEGGGETREVYEVH